MIAGNGLPWYEDRVTCFTRYFNQLMVGDSLFSSDNLWEIVYLFVNSKMPQYIVYRNGIKVFPVKKAATPKRSDLLNFLMSQNPEFKDSYFNHLGLNFVENGSIRLMTDISDLILNSDDNESNNEYINLIT